MTTAFSTLTLEVYYRYLPLYQSGGSPSDKPLPDAAPVAAKRGDGRAADAAGAVIFARRAGQELVWCPRNSGILRPG